ncbi:MAG TPA: hypothetical protein VI564_08315 [Candidatus Nanoarchaeia archaeon]|nr:hypothetical protein [Candidatus Nanoarchaeia archaeon]
MSWWSISGAVILYVIVIYIAFKLFLKVFKLIFIVFTLLVLAAIAYLWFKGI